MVKKQIIFIFIIFLLLIILLFLLFKYDKNKENFINTNNNSSFSTFVYDNYINKYNKKNIVLKIADLGCGDSVDSHFFSQKGNICYVINGNSNNHINNDNNNSNSNSNYKIVKEVVEETLRSNKLQTLFDIIYIKSFLNSIPHNKTETIFKNSINNLKPNGLICIEVQSLNDLKFKNNSKYDDNDKSYSIIYKKWLYTTEMFYKLATDNNCEILYSKEDYFLPNNKIETESINPLLIRLILKKKLLPYYEQSENYSKYKNILPKMKDKTMLSYQHMDIMNTILEKHNIKYVAVAGTILGLNRHGGIIPWDNDIDLGFVDTEWKKLLNIKEEFKNNELNYRSNGVGHCHFGAIDCFKIILKNDVYVGATKTYCHIDEYKNISKQIFGYTYIYAPLCSIKSLSLRYGKNYFYEGDVNDNFHFKDTKIKRFKLNNYDLSYQLK